LFSSLKYDELFFDIFVTINKVSFSPAYGRLLPVYLFSKPDSPIDEIPAMKNHI